MLLNAWVLKPIVYARAVQPRVERTDASSVAVRSLRGVNPNVGEVATALVYTFWNYVFFSPLDVTPVGWMQVMNFMLFLTSNKKNTLPRSSLHLDSFVVMNMFMTSKR